MLKLLKDFYRTINGSVAPVKSDPAALPEAEYLKTKRQAAIAYLGDKWLGSKAKYIQSKETA